MRDVDNREIIKILAPKLAEVAVAPEWAQFVKTGHGKQRPPIQENWWQVRAASVLMSIEKLGPVGVSKLSIKYGNRKNRGVRPEKFAPGSRNILRKILQQLETAKLAEQKQVGTHKGRVVTKQGLKLINDSANQAKKERK